MPELFVPLNTNWADNPKVIEVGLDGAGLHAAACQPCNAGKAASSPDDELVEQVSDDAVRWARARREAIEAWRLQRRSLQADLDAFTEAWNSWTCGSDDNRRPFPRDNDWENAIERWLDEGFIIEDLIDLIPKAMHNRPMRGTKPLPAEDRWRYYCGIVRRVLSDIDQAATVQRDTTQQPEPAQEVDHDAAYLQGFDDGRAYEFSRIARQRSSTHELPAPPGQRLCIECDDRAALEGSPMCWPCQITEMG